MEKWSQARDSAPHRQLHHFLFETSVESSIQFVNICVKLKIRLITDHDCRWNWLGLTERQLSVFCVTSCSAKGKTLSLPSAVNHLNAFLEREEVQPFAHILAQNSWLVVKRGRLTVFRHLRTLPCDTNAERMLTLDWTIPTWTRGFCFHFACNW